MTLTKSSLVTKILALLLYFLLAFFLAKAQVVSDFSSGTNDNWTIFNTSSGSSFPATYNAGGYITDGGTTAGPTILYAEAPAKFRGNLSSSYNQNLTFDLKTDFVGTNNTNGDVMIAGTGGTLYYQLPSKPGTSFTSYVVKLNETFAGWHFNGTATAAPTQTQMKAVLGNITSIRIRTKYTTANTTTATGSLDNVVLNIPAVVVPPIITSFTPQSGLPGTTVTINGNNFNPTVAQNLVYFNGVKGTVVNASATQLTVTSPGKISFGPITATNLANGTQGASSQNFNPLFDNNKDFGGQIIPSSFARKVDFGTSSNEVGMSAGDLDGDGLTDVLTSGNNLNASVFRNLGQTGSVSTSSFAAPLVLSIPNGVATPATVVRVGQNAIADMDGDGKLDLVINVGYNFGGNDDNGMAIFLNQSTPGNLSFSSGTVVQFSTVNNNNQGMSIIDMDGDGRPEFLGALNNSGCHLGIAQNLSSPGNLDFAAVQDFGVGATMGGPISWGDLNGDGKPEIISEAYLGGSVFVWENTSTPGTLSMGTPFSVSTLTASNFQVTDLDNDGKAELFFKENTTGTIHIKKNAHTSGPLTAADFSSDIQLSSLPTSGGNVGYVGCADLNGDGLVDIISNNGTNMTVYQNSFSGTLSSTSFDLGVTFEGQDNTNSQVICADIDGDNKPEILIKPQVAGTGKNFRVYHNECFPAPRVDSISPSAGIVGDNVNLTGDHFSTGLGLPPVYGRLGAIGAPIVPSSNTAATATVLPSISSRFSFTEHGLTAYSKPFTILFSTNQTINSSSFGPSVDFALTGTLRDAVDVADFDDDGRVDVAVIDNLFAAKIFQNTQGIPGQPITTASLAVQGTTYSSGYNLIALDIDGDGKTDLNGGGGLLQNTSSGSISFTSVTSTAGGFTTSSSADFNKDGKTDLVFTNGSLNVQVYENLSRNGSFTSSSSLFQNFGGGAVNLVAPSAPYSVVAADFDGDGYDDIISMNPNTNNASYFLNNKVYGRLSASSFSFLGNYGTSGLQPYDVTANDFDGDGKIDIAITYFNSAFVSVLLNNSVLGNISFTGTDIPVANKGYKITSQDLDGDGKAEIVVIHQPNPGPGSFTVLQNKCSVGTVSFTATNFAITRNPQAVKVTDINGDQKPDILIVASGGSTAPANALMVFENKISSPSPPIVTSFTPSSALPNTTVTINGTGFANSTAASQVFFGAVKGTILSASATQLTVKVAPYALDAPLTVENLTTNLSGISLTNFMPLFDNNKDFGGHIIPSSMDLKKDLSLGTSGVAQSVSLADLDGDGLPDLIVPQLNDSITIFRNKGNGSLTVAGFEKIRLFTGAGVGNHQAVTGDIDGDGKLDIVVIVRISNNDAALIFRNLSTTGALSFSPSFTIALPILTINNSDLAVGDMDGDGKPELLLSASDRLSVFRNTSYPGSFGFSPKVDIVGAGTKGISLGDIDGDGKLDIAMANGYYGSAGFQLTRNTSTVGTLSFATPLNFAPANGTAFNNVVLSDLDSDGKPDLSWVGFDGSNSTYILRVMKNIAVPGTVDATSFAPNIGYAENPLILSYSINPWSYSQVADINGDGKPDFIGIGKGFSISQNVGQTGVIDTNTFLEGVLFQSDGNYSTGPLAIGDLDGDGKPEVIVPYPNVSIYKNLTYPTPRIDFLKNSSGTTQTGVSGSSLFTQGDYQFTNNQSPTLRFGAVASTVTSSTNTQVTTTVPIGTSQERVAVTLHGLTGFSPLPFTAAFATAGILDATTFSSKIDYALTTSATGGLTVSDFDNDGKPDVAAGDGGNIKLFQNSLPSAGGTITASTFTSLPTLTTSIGASAITVGDFDGDGLIDLQSGSNIYHNSSGTQAEPISFETGVQAIGGSLNLSKAKTDIDFNHDGKADFVSVNAPAGSFSGITVNENFSRKGPFVAGAGGSYYNFGTFNAVVSFYTSPTIGEPLPQTTAGDFDGDGYDDIVFLAKNTNELRSMLNTKLNRRITSAQFNTYQSTATGPLPAFMVTADFDLDGKLDIAVAYTSVATISVFKNTSSLGTISFAKQDFTSLANAVNLDAADLDGDGKAEIVTIHGTTAPFNFSILKNTSTAGISFAPKIDYALATQPSGLAISDVNLDAKPDILITRVGPFLSVFQNQLASGLIITIATQPSDFIACTGDTATFTVSASGTTNITYQWQYSPDGIVAFTNLSNTSGYSNVASATLSVNTAGSFGAGRYRCKIDGDFATTVFTTDEGLFINALPTAPTTTGSTNCGSGSVTLAALGGSNGNYLWYDANGLINGQTSNTFITPVISTTTTYSVAITNGSCTSTQANVTATINPVPAAPTTQGATECTGSTFSLSASGGTNGQYVWYTTASGGTAIAGEVNSTYVTPALTTNTTYFVAVNNGACESARTPVLATVNTSGCSIPVIVSTPLATEVGGVITLNLLPLITTSNNNLDINSIVVTKQPSSGAIASVANGVLTINYNGVTFSGTEQVTVQACDTDGNCATQIFDINVAGDIIVYNGISPNGKNPAFIIEYINLLPETKDNTVYIFDRWENQVWHGTNYDNSSVVFTGVSDGGSDLPTGVYYYKINFSGGRKTETGFISLRRQ